MLTVYTITYNEEFILPYFIEHYRNRFPGCRIVVFDNDSTDKTRLIADRSGCEIIHFHTDNVLRDDIQAEIRNNCWRPWTAYYVEVTADVSWCRTPWCVIADCDEFLDITSGLLEDASFNIIRAQMIQMTSWTHGCPTSNYKVCCWKPEDIQATNLSPGSHFDDVVGKNVQFNKAPISLYHYKWIGWAYIANKHEKLAKRISKENAQNNWGLHYAIPKRIQRQYYDLLVKHSVKVLDYKESH